MGNERINLIFDSKHYLALVTTNPISLINMMP